MPSASSLGSAQGKPRKPVPAIRTFWHPRNKKSGVVHPDGYLRAGDLYEDYPRTDYEAIPYGLKNEAP